jgi:hypothetical protein
MIILILLCVVLLGFFGCAFKLSGYHSRSEEREDPDLIWEK